MSEDPKWRGMSIECPICHSPPGYICRGTFGGSSHPERINPPQPPQAQASLGDIKIGPDGTIPLDTTPPSKEELRELIKHPEACACAEVLIPVSYKLRCSCGGEYSTNMTLLSDPPQYECKCSKCNKIWVTTKPYPDIRFETLVNVPAQALKAFLHNLNSLLKRVDNGTR